MEEVKNKNLSNLEELKNLLSCIVNDEELEILSLVFKALSHPTRLKIVFMLYLAENNKICVSDIVEALDLPQPNISQHLFILRSAGIVSCERHKNFVCYQLNEGFPKQIVEMLLKEKKCVQEFMEKPKN
jgi:DNA-binding transcriptional ArsR family regulator